MSDPASPSIEDSDDSSAGIEWASQFDDIISSRTSVAAPTSIVGTGCTNYQAMTGIAFLFQNHCEKLVRSLSDEQFNNFKNIGRDMERVRYLYEHAARLPIHEQPLGKRPDLAEDLKTHGNLLFQTNKCLEALKEYNKGILICPTDTDQSRRLLALLVANRSAALFDLELYRECITDIIWVTETGWYPGDLEHKILTRLGRCYFQMMMYKEAVQTYGEAIKAAITTQMPDAKLADIRNLSKVASDRLRKRAPGERKIAQEKFIYAEFERNSKYPAVSSKVSFRTDPKVGRHAYALEEIQAGDLVLEEKAFALVVSNDNLAFNCTHCAASTLNPRVCERCTYAIFCSKECQEGASYHRVECPILATIYGSGASINCLMSLRIITKKGFSFFWSHRSEFEERIDQADRIYESSDYRRLYNLCTNEHLRPKGEFVHYTFMAIFMLRLLKKTVFFPFETCEEILREEEAYIGGLLLRHLQLLQFNAHEVAEMRNDKKSTVPYINAHVGGAIYPTLALFNHSCEPSIIRYNKGDKMIARAVKHINPGDTIFENYGPIYSSHEINYRQQKMQERYYFSCLCEPCIHDWPLYEDMSAHFLSLKCQICPEPLMVQKDQDNPFVTCSSCLTRNNIMNASLQLMKVDELTHAAEDLFRQGYYEEAINAFRMTMELFHTYMTPPFQDLVKVQQRLRTCMLHDGNAEVLYKKPTEFLSPTEGAAFKF